MSHQAFRVTCPNCVALIEFPIVPRSDSIDEVPMSGVCTACSHAIDFSQFEGKPPADPHSFANRQRAVALLNPTEASIESVLFDAFQLFRSNWKVLLGVSCLTTLIWFLLVVWPCQKLSGLWSLAQQDAAQLLTFLLASILVAGIANLTTPYTTSVIARMTLAVSRYGRCHNRETIQYAPGANETPSRGSLSVPVSVLFHMSLFMLFVAVVMAMLLVLGVIAMIAFMLVLPFPRETATLVGTFSVGCVYFVLIFTLQWLLWPTVFLIADRRASFTESLRESFSLSWVHRRVSLKVVTFYFLLSTIGALLFYVGQALTAPIASLPLAVAYLRMTGGQTALDPIE
ncbi:MAG: hypothetical protein ACF8AM_24075 [Rhodopirellula sp. JB055]|uniref:hypothetical protein n=1 Tax=Rhodopirellula sp. JB055 TaxID=3342846 RepID=UPI00370A463C